MNPNNYNKKEISTIYGVGAIADTAIYKSAGKLFTVSQEGEFIELAEDHINEIKPFGPLGADLHTHLIGTGSGVWWVNALEKAISVKPDIDFDVSIIRESLLPDDLIELLVKRSEKNKVSGNDIINSLDPDLLSSIFEIRGPIPGEFIPTFTSTFLFKDAIVQARPKTYRELILWNANRYAREHVSYVEFSVGGDLLNEAIYSEIKEGIQIAKKIGVLIRLLFAFNRQQIRVLKFPDESEELFTPTLDISVLEKKLEIFIQSSARKDGFVVGFDVVGCEDVFPYNPFLYPSFEKALISLKKQNPNFGVRIHMGEDRHPIGYLDRDAITDLYKDSILYGLTTAAVLKHRNRCKLRIGHETNYGRRDYIYSSPWLFVYLHIMERSEANLDWFKARNLSEHLSSIPVEACLTSNYFLVRSVDQYMRDEFFKIAGEDTSGMSFQLARINSGQPKCGNSAKGSLSMSQHPVKDSIRPKTAIDPETRNKIEKLVPDIFKEWWKFEKIPVCLCTDDSGAIKGLSRLDEYGKLLNEPFTLGSELGRAIDLKLITIEDIPDLAKNSLDASFAEPHLINYLYLRFCKERKKIESMDQSLLKQYIIA